MSDTSGWDIVWEVNRRSLVATLCGTFAYWCWQGFETGSVLLGTFAVMFACGTLWHGSIALFHTGRLLFGAFRFTRFKRKGVAPKADPMAKEADLKKRGLTG